MYVCICIYVGINISAVAAEMFFCSNRKTVSFCLFVFSFPPPIFFARALYASLSTQTLNHLSHSPRVPRANLCEKLFEKKRLYEW